MGHWQCLIKGPSNSHPSNFLPTSHIIGSFKYSNLHIEIAMDKENGFEEDEIRVSSWAYNVPTAHEIAFL